MGRISYFILALLVAGSAWADRTGRETNYNGLSGTGPIGCDDIANCFEDDIALRLCGDADCTNGDELLARLDADGELVCFDCCTGGGCGEDTDFLPVCSDIGDCENGEYLVFTEIDATTGEWCCESGGGDSDPPFPEMCAGEECEAGEVLQWDAGSECFVCDPTQGQIEPCDEEACGEGDYLTWNDTLDHDGDTVAGCWDCIDRGEILPLWELGAADDGVITEYEDDYPVLAGNPDDLGAAGWEGTSGLIGDIRATRNGIFDLGGSAGSHLERLKTVTGTDYYYTWSIDSIVGNHNLQLNNYGTETGTLRNPLMGFYSARGTSDSPTDTQDGDHLGGIWAFGYEDTDFDLGSGVVFISEDDWGSSKSSGIGLFTGGGTERFRLDNAGDFISQNTEYNIYTGKEFGFGAPGSPSVALDSGGDSRAWHDLDGDFVTDANEHYIDWPGHTYHSYQEATWNLDSDDTAFTDAGALTSSITTNSGPTANPTAAGPSMYVHTSASSGNAAYVTSTDIVWAGWDTAGLFQVTTYLNTSVRHWLGFFSADPTASATPNVDLMGFRFDTGASDTNWMYCVSSGGAPTCADSGVAVSNGTTYQLEVRFIDDDTDSVAFMIDGAVVGVVTSNLPTTTQNVSPWVSVTTLTTAERRIAPGRCHFIFR